MVPGAESIVTRTDFTYSGEELDALAEAHNYYAWITERFAPFLGEAIVEAGAGIGTFTEHLLGARPAARITAVEPADNNFPHLERRFAAHPRVRTVHGYLDDRAHPASTADSVAAVNVMEHVEDHAAFVAAARRALRPGGHLCLFVPALPALFGTLDEAFDHFRRYTKPTLRAVVEGAGMRVERLDYMNLPGTAAWWAAGKLLRRRTVAAPYTRFYDRWVIPAVRAVERRWSPPFGQSLLVVAQKPLESER